MVRTSTKETPRLNVLLFVKIDTHSSRCFVQCLIGLWPVRLWAQAVELDLTHTHATLLVAPGSLDQLGPCPVALATALVLEVDRMHTPAALLVVLGSLDQFGRVPSLMVTRPLLRMSRLGCVTFPSAVAWTLAPVMVLAAVVITSCHRVMVALIPVLVAVVVLATLLSFCHKGTALEELVILLSGFLPLLPPPDAVAGRPRLSLRISKAFSCFSRYPHRRPAGLSVSANGSLDIDQVWLHWGLHQGISRQQLLQCITAHAFGSEGHRRFLLRSDEDGHTWVSVAESLRRPMVPAMWR